MVLLLRFNFNYVWEVKSAVEPQLLIKTLKQGIKLTIPG